MASSSLVSVPNPMLVSSSSSPHRCCVFCSRSINAAKDAAAAPTSEVKGEDEVDDESPSAGLSSSDSEGIWHKIFEHLMFPKSKYGEVYEVCGKEGLCPTCQESFEKIGGFLKKLEETELLIRSKVEDIVMKEWSRGDKYK
jgi:hypothetical protein